MKINSIKKKMNEGQSVIGTFMKLNDAAVVEVLKHSGFDFFVADSEHVAMDKSELTNIIRTADLSDICPIIRICENRATEILHVLDLGAYGVQAPNVNTAEQARRLVDSVKYDPLGHRGFSPSIRACGYGTMNIDEYIQNANENTLVVMHCETKECVDNIDEILKTPGIDVVFIGPMDLSQSYGITGKTSDSMLCEIIDNVAKKVKASGVALGTVAGNAQRAAELIKEGYKYILLGSDQGFVLNGARNELLNIRRAVE